MIAAATSVPEIMQARTPVVSVLPIRLPAAGRGLDLQLRISAPVTGQDLPVLLFAHGFGSSMLAYGPLTDYWAAHGFIVIQPTFLDSRTVALPPDDPRRLQLWRHRVEDMTRVLDQLELLEDTVADIRGRLDASRIAVAGHSFGGQTAGILLGLRVKSVDDAPGEDLADSRVKAGVLLATAGLGGDTLTPEAAGLFPWLNPDFSHLDKPTLVICGDRDVNPFLTTRGADWSADPYHFSPGAQALLTLHGGEHSLGGIPGYESAETTDEDPARVVAVQRLSLAFLRSSLYPKDSSWTRARAEFDADASDIGRIESK